MKLTKQRKEIIEIIKNSSIPQNSEMIYQRLTDNSINLSTVYRTVEKLLEYKLVNKHYFNNVAYYTYNNGIHKHYMFCLKCQKAFEINCHLDDWLSKKDLNGFKVLEHDITLYGTCKDCS